MTHILSASDAAALMRCSVKTIEDRARTGDLPGLLWGDGGWVFPTEAFYARINELALEQAAQRRKPVAPTAVLAQQRGLGRRRPPPALPRVA
ncbi:MAG TPA: hypothetical protein P5305_01290 [Rubrivivax sp.]|nr:hypothetical protein [Rubrivivax sp.]HRY86486.1 hypothetical protein [Rubrivivax sp.]